MNPTRLPRLLALLGLLLSGIATAEGLTFGLVAKSVDDGNFIDAWLGCREAALAQGDACELLGNQGAAQPRSQLQAIEQALASRHYDALAVSVTKSDIIARGLEGIGVPVITYDSPFEADDARLSRAYVGTDNLAFGRDLAAVARRLRPRGGSLCLMTAEHDANLAQRVLGVRQALSGDPDFPPGRRLAGEGGWREPARCPWNSGDNPARVLRELELTLDSLRPDLFLSVGHWPVVNPRAYREAIAPYRAALRRGEPLVVVAVGKILPGYAALMEEGLVHGYVSINFPEIGRLSYQAMRALVRGEPVTPRIFTPNTVRVRAPEGKNATQGE